MKLNMGCWFDTKIGYINVDKVKNMWVDKVFDFEKFPYPFEDNSIDEIYCSMVMEHIHDLSKMMDELVRISKNGAQLQIEVPYFSSPNLWWDMTHIRWFNTNTFSGFHSNSLKSFWNIKIQDQKIHFLSNKRFLQSDIINKIPDFFINLFPKVYERFFSYIFPSSEIHYLIEIRKH